MKKKAAEDEAAPAEKTDKKPPDLSDVGTKQKAAWFSKFLMKGSSTASCRSVSRAPTRARDALGVARDAETKPAKK